MAPPLHKGTNIYKITKKRYAIYYYFVLMFLNEFNSSHRIIRVDVTENEIVSKVFYYRKNALRYRDSHSGFIS